MKTYKKLINFTDNSSFRGMDSGKPFYVINKLSNVIERPETNHRLHMLLRGPSANNSHIYWYDAPDQYGNVRREYKTVPYWQQCVPLYLYHGRRWCVTGSNNGDAGLFTEDENAHADKYDRVKTVNLPLKLSV